MNIYYEVLLNVFSIFVAFLTAFIVLKKAVQKSKEEAAQAIAQLQEWSVQMSLSLKQFDTPPPILEKANTVVFAYLVRLWKNDTKFLSSPIAMAEHPAYRAIVAMGEKAVPLILAEMEREPDFWFEALWEITGDNPVKPEDAGKVVAMTKAWLEWGSVHEFRQPEASRPSLSESNAIEQHNYQ